MMVNTAASILPAGGTAVLTSPVRQGTAKPECVHFWYHMGGVEPGETRPQAKASTKKKNTFTRKTHFNCVYPAGSLTVYMKPVKGERVKIFSDSLNQGDVWRHGNGNISSALVDWQVQCWAGGAAGIIVVLSSGP